MKNKYKLVKASLVGIAGSLMLSYTGCSSKVNEKNNVTDIITKGIVAEVDNEIHFLRMEDSSCKEKVHYVDILDDYSYCTNIKCDSSKKVNDIKIIGDIIDYMSIEQIQRLIDGDFDSRDWMSFYEEVSNEYYFGDSNIFNIINKNYSLKRKK